MSYKSIFKNIIFTISILTILIFILNFFFNSLSTISAYFLDNIFGLVKHNDSAWYLNTKTIAHAGGIYNYQDHTNSKEAIEEFLMLTEDEKVRVVELDFQYTSDNALVCAHLFSDYGMNEIPTHDEFMSSKVLYTSIDLNDVIEYLKTYDNLYIMVDTKVENYNSSLSIVDVAKTIMNSVPNKLKDRFIFQLYIPEQKVEMQKIYDFKDENLVLSLYKSYYSISDTLNYIYEYNYKVVLFGDGYFTESEMENLKHDDIYMNIFTINDETRKEYYDSFGNSIIITDYLY